nr:hypothetical protein [Tanacetum cinerariifolium]
MRLRQTLQQVARHVGQVRNLLDLGLQVADHCPGADALTHPALQERLSRAPQVQLRVQLAAQTFDVEQGLLQQHQLRLHFHVETARGLEQAHQHLTEGNAAHDAAVDGNVLRIPRRNGADEDVAGVHVGVEKAVAEHLGEEQLHATFGEFLHVGALIGQGRQIGDLNPVDALHHQYF